MLYIWVLYLSQNDMHSILLQPNNVVYSWAINIPYGEYPSWLHKTLASWLSQKSPHNVVHIEPMHISTRPANALLGPINRTSPFEQKSTQIYKYQVKCNTLCKNLGKKSSCVSMLLLHAHIVGSIKTQWNAVYLTSRLGYLGRPAGANSPLFKWEHGQSCCCMHT